MNIFLVTDLEAVAGVLDSVNWCKYNGRYYDHAKELLTLETNAAIDGFFAAGATKVTVCDGHGCGGINPSLLDPRAELIAGRFTHVGWPLGMTKEYDFIAWVGQHAMANTPYNHLAHTGAFEVRSATFNGTPIGEIARFGYCAAELGARLLFLSGDQAACHEIEKLTPGIHTVAVKFGLAPTAGDDFTPQEALEGFTAARHLSPLQARHRIREKSEVALKAATQNPELGRLVLPTPPFKIITTLRKSSDGTPGKTFTQSHPDSYIAALNSKRFDS